MAGTTLVRRLQESDWAALRDARLAALADAPYAFSSTLAREQQFTEELWRRRTQSGAVFAAWSGAQIAGLATARLDAEGWQLLGMWVHRGLRGTGIAGALVDAVCAHARDAGAAGITLWVTDVNARAAAFYARMGFVPTGVRQPVRPEEPGHSESQLVRDLRPPVPG